MKENRGFTKFPNELLEKLMTADLTAREYRIVLSIIRYTLGYHVIDGESFSVSRLCEIARINRSSVSKALNNLIKRRIVLECSEPNFNSSRVILVNLVLDEWETTTVAKGQTQTVSKKLTPTVSKSTTHTSYIKENNKEIYKYKKNELKKEKKPSYDLELFEQMLNSKD